MLKDYVKNLLKNWKFSVLVLVISIVLNIIFLCQPVFGTYTGQTKQYNETYITRLSFNSKGYADFSYSKGEITAYDVGVYQRIDDDIVVIIVDTNSSFSTLSMRKRVFTRNSVFSISWGEDKYASISAIFLQIFFVIVDLTFAIRFVLQFREQNIANKTNDAEQLNS